MPKLQGILFSLKGTSLGATYEKLKESSRSLVKDARALGYWNYGGTGGRFTKLAAEAFKSFIIESINGLHPEVTSGFQMYSRNYSVFKESEGDALFWLRTGNTRDSFIVKSSTISDKTMAWVTIDPKATTPRVNWDGQHIPGDEIRVIDLVRYLEFGTKDMPARPLVSSALMHFVMTSFPRMKDSIQNSVKEWLAENHVEYGGSRQQGGDISDLVSVASSNPESDFRDEIVKEAVIHSGAGVGELDLSSENRKANKAMEKMLRSSGISEEEIRRILEGMEGL